MPRRSFRDAGRMVFVGWDPSARGYYTNVVDLCRQCDGWGEDPETDTFCPDCQAEGVNWNGRTIALSGLSLDALVSALGGEGIAVPEALQAELKRDTQSQ